MTDISQVERKHPVVATVLLLGAVCLLIGWFGFIFGPWYLFPFAVVGFVVTFTVGLLSKRLGLMEGPSKQADARTRTNRVIRFLGKATMILVAVSMVVFFAVSRDDGNADYPALEWRPVYQLENHGHLTTVSRVRFVTISICFYTGWSALALVVNLSLLHKALYGEDIL